MEINVFYHVNKKLISMKIIYESKFIHIKVRKERIRNND